MTRQTKDTPPPKTKWVQILIVTGVVVGGATALCYYKLRTSPRPTPVAWRGNTASRNRGNGVGAGGAARRPTAQAAKQAWNPDVLTRGLRDMNDAAQAQALAKISEWVSVDPASAAWPLENQWGKYLLASRHYQEAADMALACILEVPTNSDLVCGLLRLRARALLGQGKPAEALQCAKSLYNLSPLDRADEALYLVAFCLAQAQPADPGLYQRFCQEQQRGAAAAPTLPSSPLMASIHVDPAPYAPILARAFDDSDNQSILAYANMALAADQPAKARETFALLAHQDANRLVDIAARLMKAEDGTVGRATPDRRAESRASRKIHERRNLMSAGRIMCGIFVLATSIVAVLGVWSPRSMSAAPDRGAANGDVKAFEVRVPKGSYVFVAFGVTGAKEFPLGWSHYRVDYSLKLTLYSSSVEQGDRVWRHDERRTEIKPVGATFGWNQVTLTDRVKDGADVQDVPATMEDISALCGIAGVQIFRIPYGKAGGAERFILIAMADKPGVFSELFAVKREGVLAKFDWKVWSEE